MKPKDPSTITEEDVTFLQEIGISPAGYNIYNVQLWYSDVMDEINELTQMRGVVWFPEED